MASGNGGEDAALGHCLFYSNENSLAEIGVDDEVDEKGPKGSPKPCRFGSLDGNLGAVWLRWTKPITLKSVALTEKRKAS